jgi:hypothetical protein
MTYFGLKKKVFFLWGVGGAWSCRSLLLESWFVSCHCLSDGTTFAAVHPLLNPRFQWVGMYYMFGLKY